MENDIAEILLVNPPVYDFAAYDLFNKPLGLLYLAGFLRQVGYDVRLVDALDRNHPGLAEVPKQHKTKSDGTGKYHSQIIDKPARLAHIRRYYRRFGMPAEVLGRALADQRRADAVLITSMMTYWYGGVADTIGLIREKLPGVPIGMGGVYAQLMPEHAKKTCQPDMLFVDNSILSPLRWLDKLTGASRDYSKIDEGFSAWPVPAYDLYHKLDYITVITSLGCPYNCDYCASKFLQPRLQQLRPDLFIDQLKHLLGLMGTGRSCYNIAFMDDALLANAANHIIPILQKTLDFDLPMRFYCPNGLHCRFITAELAKLMRRNNVRMIRLSYESSVGRWQFASDNKTSDRFFCRAVDNLTSAGYVSGELEAYIIVGLPGQTMDEIESSAAAVHKMGVKVRLCQYSPIPNTKLFELSCEQYDIDPTEPLLHNNTILATLDRRVSRETFQQFKDNITETNLSLGQTQ